jgi:glycosyltransferase involved in cell wall biosynthesis
LAALAELSGRAARPLSVTLVTHYYPAHRGGVERIAGQLAERVAAAGVARIDWHASDCDAAPAPVAGVRAVPAASCNFAERRLGFPYPLWSAAALRRLARACREADVVHLHDCLYFPNVVAFHAARRARRPVLVTQHIGEVPYRSRLLRGAQRAANRALGHYVLGGADQVVFESESVRRYFSRFVRFRRPALVVENGVDTGLFRPVSEDARRALRDALGVPSEAPLLLFLGRFVEKKGLPVLRELTARLPRAHWVFAGWGPLDPATWRRENVTVLHSPRSIVELYQAADLLVLPSVGEGFPLSVQEAMACGTPALVGAETAAGSPHAANVLLAEPAGSADTVERWTLRLQALLGSPQALQALRPQVARFAREHWSWERCAASYGELLRACAGLR